MKKILILFVLLSCMVVHGSNLTDEDIKILNQITNNNYTIDWHSYVYKISKKIKSNWQAPKSDITNQVVVIINIAKDGALIDTKISKSSGDNLADIAVLDAIKKTAPFDSLPVEFKGEFVPIELTFDYRIFNKPIASKADCKTKLCKFIYEHQ